MNTELSKNDYLNYISSINEMNKRELQRYESVKEHLLKINISK